MTIQTTDLVVSQELLHFQDEAGVEFADGAIVEKPVSIESSEIEGTIFFLLKMDASQDGGARVFPASMGYQCFADEPAKFRKPDVSVVRSERMSGIDPTTGLMPIPPDLAVEVVSPNDRVFELAEKVEEYLQNGFPLVWIVEPRTKTVTIRRANGSATLLHANDEITGEAALPTFRRQVAAFFAK